MSSGYRNLTVLVQRPGVHVEMGWVEEAGVIPPDLVELRLTRWIAVLQASSRSAENR